jgi:hypothetical protein
VTDHVDAHLAEVGNDANTDLHKEPHEGRQAEEVIEKSEKKHRGSEKEERPSQKRRFFRMRSTDCDEAGEEKNAEQGHSSDSQDGLGLELADAIACIPPPFPNPEAPEKDDGEQSDGKGGEKDGDSTEGSERLDDRSHEFQKTGESLSE